MHSRKVMFSLFFGGAMAVAHIAKAEDVGAQKSAAYPNLLPNAYGVIDLRHYNLRENTADGGRNINPRVQSRLTLGSTFMDGKLDVSGAMAVTARPATEKFFQRRPEINVKYTAASGSFFEVGPELQILTPHEGQGKGGTDASPGVFASLSAPALETVVGKLSTSLSGEWTATFSSRAADAEVENESPKTLKELGLVGEKDAASGTRANGKQDLDYAAEYIASASLAIGKVSVVASQYLDQTYLPRYVASGEQGDIEVSYPVQTTTTESLKVAYKITDKTTLSNEVLLQQSGVYERKLEGADNNKGLPAFSNIAKIAYSL